MYVSHAVSHVINDPGWDSTSVCTASGILNIMNNQKFVCLLVLFSKIFIFISHILYSTKQINY